MTKIDLQAIGFTDSTSTLINSNSAEIENKSDTFLSRDGTTPNAMLADLDMNSNRILNLPAPVNGTEPLRLKDFDDAGGTINIFAGIEYINVKDYGALGDDSTNNFNAITAALAAASGKVLYFPTGTYRVPVSLAVTFTPGANTKILGDGVGRSIIKFIPDSAAFRACIDNTAGNLYVQDMSLVVTPFTNGSCTIFNYQGSGLYISDCELDGGTTNVGATVSTVDSVAINCATTGTQNDLVVKNCTIHRFRFPLLKPNASTSTQKYLRFFYNTFYNNYNEDLSFNSPNGVMDTVIAEGNIFRDALGSSASISQRYLAFASVTHFNCTNNKFSGTVNDAFHVEENSKYGVISGNDINVDGDGFHITDNNIAGAATMPQFLTITGNSVKKAGTQKSANSTGIFLVYDGSSEVPLKNSVVSNNVVDGYESGIYIGQTLDDSVIVSDNSIFNCTHGLRSPEGPITASGNLTNGCTTGVSSVDGGSIYGHIFNNCTTNVDAVGEAVTLIDPVFIFPEFSVGAASTTNKDLVPFGTTDRGAGFFQGIVTSTANADYTTRQYKVNWNGATFRTVRWDQGGDAQGGVVVTPVRNSSMLAAQVFSTSARTIRLQVRFNGFITVADTFNTVAGTNVSAEQISVEDASTNTVSPVLDVLHRSTGTAANGIGTRIRLKAQTTAGETEIASVDAVTTDVTNGSEDADIVFRNIVAGTVAERARINGTGLDLSQSTSGQIIFPGTQNSSAGANTLDDYEEGQTTPTVTASVGTFTTVSCTLNYTKVGRLVTCGILVTITTAGTAAGTLQIPLPFTPSGSGGGAGAETAATGRMVGGAIINATSTLFVTQYDGTTIIANGRTINMSATYMAAT